VNNVKTRVLTTKEENLLLTNAVEPLKSMIRIALLTGLRLNSIRTLAWKLIDFSTNTITVDAVYSKNKRSHTIPMSTTLRQLLLEAKVRCGGKEYVFPEAMALTQFAISARFAKLCRELGVKDFRFHDLRHTCGTRMAERGHGVETISKALGHASITMSSRYVHPKESVKRAMEDLANFESFATNLAASQELPDSNGL
jgi:integrase